jgi:hypothetical protein
MIDTNTDMRFMSNNFLETGFNSLDVTSTAVGYYKSDLYSPERSRTFKFGKRFQIEEDVNDLLYIDGVTIQIPPGTGDVDTFVGTVNSNLTPPMTLTYDHNTFKFTFSSSNDFTLDASNTTNSMWATLGIIEGADISVGSGSGGSKVSDIPRVHYPNEKITGDLGYQGAIGFVGIIGDLTRELRIPEGSVVTFKANTVNDFTTPLVNKVLTWTKRGLFAFIDEQADTNFRYFEITFAHPDGPFVSEVGYLYVGDYSNFTERNVSVGVGLGFVDTSLVSRSDDGQKYTNQKTAYRTLTGLAVGLAKPVNVTFLKRLYYLKQNSSPFFVSLDPKTEITESIDDMTIFCRFAKEPDTRQILYNNYELNFELEEAL